MYRGRSKSIATTTTATRAAQQLLCLLLITVLNLHNVVAMSLDRLALERNELSASVAATTNSESEPVNDLKLTAVPAEGNTDNTYMLLPETVVSQLDDAENVNRNVIEAEQQPAPGAAAEETDMLMLESDDTPAMQLVELPSDITVAETAADEQQAPEPEQIVEHVVEQVVAQEQPAQTIAEAEPIAVEQDTTEAAKTETQNEAADEAAAAAEDIKPETVAESLAELLSNSEATQSSSSSQEAQLEDVADVAETATEAAAIATTIDEQQPAVVEEQPAQVEPAAIANDVPVDEATSATESVVAEIVADAVQAVEKEIEQTSVDEPSDDQAEVTVTEAETDSSSTEKPLISEISAGFEEGLTAAMDNLLPEELAEAEADKAQAEEASNLETIVEPIQQEIEPLMVDADADAAAAVIVDESQTLPEPIETAPEAIAIAADEVVAAEPIETAVDAEQNVAEPSEPTPEAVQPAPEDAQVSTETEQHWEPAEVAAEVVAVEANQSEAEAEPAATTEAAAFLPIAADEQLTETDAIKVEDTAPALPAEEPVEQQSILTTIIQTPVSVEPQPAAESAAAPTPITDSVLNYVNASYTDVDADADMDAGFSNHLRRYDGAQVWRIVVQTDKDKKLADELQTKYDGQLWKEVKQEVDYLLKPQVLAAAERHIRAANLSRIVLIDNLQQVIEVENPSAEEIAELQNRKGHRLTWQAYHRLEDIHGFVDYMAKTYPDICSVETIGYSVEKRPLKILKISNGNARNPGIWIDGGMHAREWISPATVTYIANQLVEGWEDLPEHMRNINWYIHPVANPDGYEYSHTTDRLWRKNMRAHGRQCPGVDLNRNFGYKWGGKGTSASPCSQTYRGSKAFSEPETFYISKFISGFPRDTFQAYLSFHSYGQYILYPWGYDYHLTQDRADLDRVARQAGTSITKTTGVKYTVGSSATTLYPAAGGSDDWAKGIAGIKYAYTIEMGDTGRYGFVLPAKFIHYNGKDGFTFADTVARAVTRGKSSPRRRAF